MRGFGSDTRNYLALLLERKGEYQKPPRYFVKLSRSTSARRA